MTDADKLALVRSIVVSAEIEAGNDLSHTASAAIAWRTIGQLRQVLTNDENSPSNLVTIHDLPGHAETMAGLDKLTIWK